MQIRLIQQDEFPTVIALANEIWPKAYGSILSQAQIQFMIDKFYTQAALDEQQAQGQVFHLLESDGKAIGYCAYEHQADGQTKLHKLYVLPDVQKKGAGRLMTDFVLQKAKEHGSHTLYLNVNRHNDALGFYKHLGFILRAEENIPIGQGYWMEDYVLACSLSPKAS